MEYKIAFFKDNKGYCQVREYLDRLGVKDRAKVLKYVDFLRTHKGILDEPYSRHIKGKIRELRVDLQNRRHRVLYFTFINKIIILLHAFLKKSAKTPMKEIIIAENNYKTVLNNRKSYE